MNSRTLFFHIIVALCITGCRSFLYNIGLENIGVYDDEIKLKKIQRVDQKVVFFPMVHIGTEARYQDIKIKVDSLKKLNFTFYLESVVADIKEDSMLRKYRKITGISLNKKGYTDNIDSLFKGKFKPKKEIISQPSYIELGIDSTSGRVVDRTLSELLQYYEDNYGKILLEDCDFKTSLYETTVCKDKKIEDSVVYDYRTHYRNKKVIQEVLQDTATKIAIIYGGAHVQGIIEELLSNGFSEY